MNVRESILRELSSCIKSIQEQFVLSGKSRVFGSDELTNQLCCILEAIYFHELRANWWTSYFAKSTNQSNFWPLVQRFTHKNVVDSVNQLSQIVCDVGRSKAWIRLGLNDGLVVSYLTAISADTSQLRLWYNQDAFLLDEERVLVTLHLLRGLEGIEFDIPTNSTVLNQWTSTTLALLRVDSAEEKTSEFLDSTVRRQFLSSSRGRSMSDFAAYEASPPSADRPFAAHSYDEPFMPNESESEQPRRSSEVEGGSPSFPSFLTASCELTDSSESSLPGNRLTVLSTWSSFGQTPKTPEDATCDEEDFSFELIENQPENRWAGLAILLAQPCHEKPSGEDFACKGCEAMLGLIYGTPRLCHLDGHYYCSTCHHNDKMEIPHRIVQSWDLKKYPVSQENKKLLDDIWLEPLFDLAELNPSLYDRIGELERMRTLRQQLNSLGGYLFTCRKEIADEFRRSLWPQEYLFSKMHCYSLQDLIQLGALSKKLKKIVQQSVEHVRSCLLCRQKGFICEVCRDPQIIYPFDLEETFRCAECAAIFHRHCKKDDVACPRCQRRRVRNESLLIGIF